MCFPRPSNRLAGACFSGDAGGPRGSKPNHVRGQMELCTCVQDSAYITSHWPRQVTGPKPKRGLEEDCRVTGREWMQGGHLLRSLMQSTILDDFGQVNNLSVLPFPHL